MYNCNLNPIFEALGELPLIKEAIYNDPVTVINWNDGVKTVVRCNKAEGDVYDEKVGFLLCVMKRMYGNTSKYNNVLKKFVPGYGTKTEDKPFNEVVKEAVAEAVKTEEPLPCEERSYASQSPEPFNSEKYETPYEEIKAAENSVPAVDPDLEEVKTEEPAPEPVKEQTEEPVLEPEGEKVIILEDLDEEDDYDLPAKENDDYDIPDPEPIVKPIAKPFVEPAVEPIAEPIVEKVSKDPSQIEVFYDDAEDEPPVTEGVANEVHYVPADERIKNFVFQTL